MSNRLPQYLPFIFYAKLWIPALPWTDEGDACKQVKGWFPRGCIHPLSIQFSESEHPNDSQVSDTQVSTHSDSQYSQVSESDQDSAGSDRKTKKHNLDTDTPGERRRKRSSKVTEIIKKTKRSPVPSPRRSPQPTEKAMMMPNSAKGKEGEDIKSRSPIMTRRRKKWWQWVWSLLAETTLLAHTYNVRLHTLYRKSYYV